MSRLITEILAFIPKYMREAIGAYVGIYLFVFAPMVVIGGAMYIMKALREPKVEAVACWKIQEAGVRVFKVNACTGESVELPAKKYKEDESTAMDQSNPSPFKRNASPAAPATRP